MIVVKRMMSAAVMVSFAVGLVAAQKKTDEILPPRDHKPLAMRDSPQLQTLLAASIDDMLTAKGPNRSLADNIAAILEH